ncbi:hypothetical protein P7K49_024147, partial [Saguinus oedipus]
TARVLTVTLCKAGNPAGGRLARREGQRRRARALPPGHLPGSCAFLNIGSAADTQQRGHPTPPPRGARSAGPRGALRLGTPARLARSEEVRRRLCSSVAEDWRRGGMGWFSPKA